MKIFMTCLGLISFAVTSFAAVTIDDFSVGDLEFTSSGSTSQTGLDPNAVLGGKRSLNVSALQSAGMDVRINSTAGTFSFSSVNYGYFTLTYMMDPLHPVDLKADGSTAFLLNFSYVDKGALKNLYQFSVDEKIYNLPDTLRALNGPGSVVIPFSWFTTGDSLRPSVISFSASRVPPGLRFELSSITTIPEPGTGLALMSGTILTVMTRRRH